MPKRIETVLFLYSCSAAAAVRDRTLHQRKRAGATACRTPRKIDAAHYRPRNSDAPPARVVLTGKDTAKAINYLLGRWAVFARFFDGRNLPL